MPDNRLRFYLDEKVQVVIANQLKRLGIEALTVRDLDVLGDADEDHLKRATAMGYVLCTHDDDYLILLAEGVKHAGIVFGVQDKHTIEEMVNRVEFLTV